MAKNPLFDLNEKLYAHEIQVREALGGRLQTPMAIIVSLTNFQYRQAIEKLSIEALFVEPLKEQELLSLIPHFYRHFDLYNEQTFLFSLGRVSKKPGRTGKMELRATWTSQLSKLLGMRLLASLVATSNRLEPYALQWSMPPIHSIP